MMYSRTAVFMFFSGNFIVITKTIYNCLRNMNVVSYTYAAHSYSLESHTTQQYLLDKSECIHFFHKTGAMSTVADEKKETGNTKRRS